MVNIKKVKLIHDNIGEYIHEIEVDFFDGMQEVLTIKEIQTNHTTLELGTSVN